MIIGLCSIYISANSIDCTGVAIPNSVYEAEQSLTSDFEKKCFCNSNFISSLSSNRIQVYCGSLLDEIYTEQGIQYVIIATSGLVNFLFGLVVNKIVNFTQPASHSSGFIFKTAIFTIFMIINTVFLPLLIYANIFGVKPSFYISFITIISTDLQAFFDISNITLNEDFNPIWYRNVSPVFTNYVIFDALFTWIFFIIFKVISNK